MQQGISKGGSVTQVTKCLSSSHLGKVSLQFDDPAPEHDRNSGNVPVEGVSIAENCQKGEASEAR